MRIAVPRNPVSRSGIGHKRVGCRPAQRSRTVPDDAGLPRLTISSPPLDGGGVGGVLKPELALAPPAPALPPRGGKGAAKSALGVAVQAYQGLRDKRVGSRPAQRSRTEPGDAGLPRLTISSPLPLDGGGVGGGGVLKPELVLAPPSPALPPRGGKGAKARQGSRFPFPVSPFPGPLSPAPGAVSPVPFPRSRAGFTLVEMLVAVGVVVLMMTLFTTIFQMATGAMSKQKALTEGDQRVRMVVTLLRNDLLHRTFTKVAPWLPSEAPVYPADTDLRFGYFYIAENDPDDDTDDILQLTVRMTAAEDQVFGRSFAILPDALGNWGPAVPAAAVTDPTAAPPGNYYWPNQPEFDDQLLGFQNHAGAEATAEVCWFLRNGTLYRRVVLIRDIPTGTPTDALNNSLSTAAYESAGVRNFWTDFDYSAHYETIAPAGPRFHGTNELNPTLAVFPLGNPQYRFGFNIVDGRARQFVQDTGGVWRFFGRFTHNETSYTNAPAAVAPVQFGYPGRIDANAPNPFDPATPLTYNSVTDRFAEYNGSRIAEDVVMTQVHRFDIKVFDEAATYGPDRVPGFVGDDDVDAVIDFDGTGNPDPDELGWPGSDDGDFVDLGHPGRGFYSAAAFVNSFGYWQNHPAYLALATPVNKPLYAFDTWNPNIDLDGNPGADLPPFSAPDLPAAGGRRFLRAIQITITFFDTTSQTMRDVTFVQSVYSPP
ncbi:MAG: PulJ/GspJ family protein [Planctomycetaceae bacterium]